MRSVDLKGVALLHEHWDYTAADFLPRLNRFFSLISATAEARLPLHCTLPLSKIDGILDKMKRTNDAHAKKGERSVYSWRKKRVAKTEENIKKIHC